MNVLRGLQTAESLVKNQERNCHQGRRIHQGRQNSGAVIAICRSRTGRARLQINGEERQQQREKIRQIVRSEEHTSELQSRGHLVCRLLLEKKNTSKIQERQA